MVPSILTPAERRLAALVFTLTLIGSLARVGRGVSPAVEAWLAEVADTAAAAAGDTAAVATDPPAAKGSAAAGPPAPAPESPPPGGPASPVDPNRAGYEDLLGLPGVGPVLARRILDDRRQNGPFRSPEDLLRVHGIGKATLERLRPHLAVAPRGG